MPKYKFEHERKEQNKQRINCLQALLSFAGRDTALEVVMGTAKLTKWGVLNKLMDCGFQVIGSDKRFTIDTGCGLILLDCTHWELSFEDDSFESYFYKRAIHLEQLMQKTHYFRNKDSESVESATA